MHIDPRDAYIDAWLALADLNRHGATRAGKEAVKAEIARLALLLTH